MASLSFKRMLFSLTILFLSFIGYFLDVMKTYQPYR